MSVPSLALAAAALLLIVSGAAKLREPLSTVPALASLGVPRRLRSLGVIRAGAGAEVAVGVAVLAGAGRGAAALLALAYLGFLAVAARLRIVARGSGCGCFGESSAPVGTAHLRVTGGGIAAGATAALRGETATSWTHAGVATATAAALLVVALTAATYVLLTSWGTTARLARRGTAA